MGSMHKHLITHRLVLPAALAATLALTACGGGSDAASDNGDASGGDDNTSGLDAATVATCLENRGFEVTREADQDEALVLPDEYKESVGLIENLTLGSIGDRKGIGSVGIYADADAATEANEASAGMRTDDVFAGATGVASWDYIITAGDDPGIVPMIDACLS